MRRQPALSYLSLVGALIAASVLVALSLAGKDIRPLNASLVLLLRTLASAATFGFLGGTITAVLSNLVMSYFFLAPVHDIWVSDPQARSSGFSWCPLSEVRCCKRHVRTQRTLKNDEGRRKRYSTVTAP